MVNMLNDFTEYLVADKKVSANTLQSYIRDIKQYMEYLQSSGISGCADVTPTAYLGYITYLQKMGKAPTSVSRVIASTRSFYRFLCSKKMCDINPVEKVHALKSERKLPQILTGEEIQLLLAQPSGKDFKGKRDKAMLELLYATGIKVTELIELNVDDINLQIGILHMHSAKGERIIPIYPDAVKSLKNYLINVRNIVVENENEQRLFTNMSGQPMTRQGFWKIIKQYASSAKIKKDITPHTIRHSFAAHLLENGAQLSDIKEMLGHADISSTQIYAQLMKNKYASSYSRFHPLAK